AGDPPRRWELLPHFVLRSTGFPFRLIDEVAFAKTGSALDALLDAEEDLKRQGGTLASLFPRAAEGALGTFKRRCWDSVRRMRPIDPLPAGDGAAAGGKELRRAVDRWNRALGRCGELEASARTVFAEEIVERRSALRDVAAGPRFQEAVWLCSPQMWERGVARYLSSWDASRRPSEVRRIERQLVSYLQRFCAKNDTASFFGPIDYGDFSEPTTAGGQDPAPGPGRLQRREAFMAWWAVAALAVVVGADPSVRPYLRPRPGPLAEIDAGARRATVAHRATFALSDAELELLAHLDGRRTVAEVGAAAGLPPQDALARLEALARRHLVVVALQVPPTALRPLGWLIDWVDSLPA